MTVSAAVALPAGYALLLLLAAEALDRLAQHTHRRSERFRTAGFRYSPDQDAWTCPQDQHLWPEEYDAERRLVRYRAKPIVCNACPVKSDCTSSPHGREIVRPLDPWPHSEAGRFHRGIALVLVGLAAAFAVTALLASSGSADLLVAGAVLLCCLGVGWRLTGHFRRTPVNFPAPTPSTGLRLHASKRAERAERSPR